MNEDITRLMLLDNIRNCNYREEHHIDEDDDDDIRNILNSIRSNRESLHEDFNNMNQQSDSINMENIQPLSSTINDWKNNIRQNLQSNVQFESFLYYPKDNDVTVNFSVSDMNNAKIQMRWLNLMLEENQVFMYSIWKKRKISKQEKILIIKM